MKKTKFLITLLPFAPLLTLSLFFNKANVVVAVGTNNQPEYIGDMFTYSHVETTTKVYVSGTLLQYVYEAGRTVYIEPFDPFIPTEGINIINDEENIEETDYLNNRNPFDRHYYYATPTSPRISGKHQMYNNVESLIYAVQQLEADAAYYNDSSPKNAVLGYIRTINKNYSSNSSVYSEWNVVAGVPHTSFINQMNLLTVGGLEINEYFASFIEESYYNSSLHKTCRQDYLDNNYKLIAGPSSNCVEIDLIHMFATIDGTANGTEATTNEFPYCIFGVTSTYKQLCGWAGDMQTAIMYFGLGNNPNQTFNVTDFLNNDASTFPYSDLYADIDAVNMFSTCNLSTCSNISLILDTYFNLFNSGQFNRFNSFVINVVNMVYGSSNNYSSDFDLIIKDFCGLNANGNDILEQSFGFQTKYKILETPSGQFIPAVYRQRMASVFSNYILMMGSI